VGQGSNFWFTARFDQPAMLTSLNSATSPLPTMAMPNVPLLMIGIGTEANNPVLAQLRHWQLNIDYLQAAADLEPAISLLQQRLADKNRIQPKAVFIDHPQLSEARAFWLAKLLNITENNIFWVELTPLANSNRNEPSQSGHLRLAKPLRRENLFNVLQTVSQNLTLADKVTTVPSIAATAVPSAHRLLLVEDNVINQKVALGLLAKLGYRADVARDGHEALACLQNNQYDLILMDCHMPGMDGFQATAAIRRNEENRGQRIPIIALTADDTPEDEARCRAVGMDAHLGKPINREALRAVLAAWLD
jgi:CheY-like chemotaxis protein